MEISGNGIARRARIDLNTPAELTIRDAMRAVEAIGAHTLLTEAVNLLSQALEKVADYVELLPQRPKKVVFIDSWEKDRNKRWRVQVDSVEAYNGDSFENAMSIKQAYLNTGEYVDKSSPEFFLF